MALRRRVKRDLILVLGVVAILCTVLVLNYSTGLVKLAKQFEAMRSGLEEKRAAEGIELLSWKLMRNTGGSLRAGGEFDPELVAKDNTRVNLIGFMVPFEQFNNMTEFLLLPLPLECYFCRIPPPRDVMYARMLVPETTKLYNEPVLLKGLFKIHREAGTKFFYSIEDVTLEPAEAGGKLNKKTLDIQHTVPGHMPETTLEPGYAPPKPQQ